MGRCWIGVDVGTSALKVLALRGDGSVVATNETPLPVDRPLDDRAEADPQAWLAVVRAALADVVSRTGDDGVAGVGVTGQMHGTVLVDPAGGPVGPAVLWPDRRAADQADRWAQLPGAVQAQLGGPFSPGMTGPVLGWCAEHEPARLATASRVVLPKDWVRRGLTGDTSHGWATDPSDASGTLLWDVTDGVWSAPALAAARVSAELLPAVLASDGVVGEWSPLSAARAPVVVGAGDTPATLLALDRCIGGWCRGDIVVNLGTGAQVIAPATDPPGAGNAPDRHLCADAAGGYYAMVAIQNAGLALAWVRDLLGLTWPELAEVAQAAEPGARGIAFVPFVTGERWWRLAPARDVNAPGWLGATRNTPVDQLARAAVEAQAFLVRRAYEVLSAGAGRVLLVGGGTRDRWVQQLLADCLGLTVRHVELASAAASGAAVLAAQGVGGELTLSAASVEVPPRHSPALDEAYLRWCSAIYG